jgi:hypothetical protein
MPQPICDFCSTPDITRRYKCRSFDFVLGWGSKGDWAACDRCAALVDGQKWDELAELSVVTFVDVELSAEERRSLKQLLLVLHQKFNDNRTEPADVKTPAFSS